MEPQNSGSGSTGESLRGKKNKSKEKAPRHSEGTLVRVEAEEENCYERYGIKGLLQRLDLTQLWHLVKKSTKSCCFYVWWPA